MKKAKGCSFILIAVMLCCLICPVRAMALQRTPSGRTQDRIQKDTIVALLYPKIEEEVNNYYQPYFRDIPQTAPYFVDVLRVDAEKSNPSNVNYSTFRVKVQLSPYLGPHNPVGTDQITFKIDMSGKIKVEKFDHIKSYKLPWNYRDSAKGAWPPVETPSPP